MWPFSKKKKEEEPEEEDDSEDEGSAKAPEDAGLAQKIEMINAELTKINGNIESFKESRKSTTERFATINENIGELRGMVNDTQRSVGMIEVKATKAADLVESVHPDKLMIQVQRVDGKIEGLRGIVEAKEEMMKNLMDQVKQIRDQMNVFRGIEQVIKLSEEVKDELMTVKKIAAAVERHADRVDNVFIEAQKSFEAFNTFSDRLDDLKAEQKEINTKVDKTEVTAMAAVKKKDFDEKIATIEKFDKKAKKVLEKVEKYFNQLDERFGKLEGRIEGQFNFKIAKAEAMSRAFEDMLRQNPMFAEGLNMQGYLNKHISWSEWDADHGGAPATAEAKTGDGDAPAEDGAEGDAPAEGESGSDAPAEDDGSGRDAPADAAPAEGADAPPKEATEGMTPVKE